MALRSLVCKASRAFSQMVLPQSPPLSVVIISEELRRFQKREDMRVAASCFVTWTVSGSASAWVLVQIKNDRKPPFI